MSILHEIYFNNAFFVNFQVLCELQIAMLEKGIGHEDITREIMSGDYRDIDCDTIRNIRDWVIFRDYVSTLEFIQESFTHFLVNLDAPSS